jgi:heme/copper-type cytochrome/quinol oxidase subunit 3
MLHEREQLLAVTYHWHVHDVLWVLRLTVAKDFR